MTKTVNNQETAEFLRTHDHYLILNHRRPMGMRWAVQRPFAGDFVLWERKLGMEESPDQPEAQRLPDGAGNRGRTGSGYHRLRGYGYGKSSA